MDKKSLQEYALSSEWKQLALLIKKKSSRKISEDLAEEIEEALQYVPKNGLLLIIQTISNKPIITYCKILILNIDKQSML